jgi:hypothetical protein
MSNNGCGQLGAIQTRGTCWFYSILNGFILSEDGQKILYNRLTNFYKKLKPAEKAYFDDKFNAPCPMKNLSKTKEIYFWKFIDQYLCFMSGPRAVSLKAGKSASILKDMSLQGTVAKNMGGKGAFPQVEIGKILDHVGFAKDYYFQYDNDPDKFHAGRKPQFVVVMDSKHSPKSLMDRIPGGLLEDPKYQVMCASLIIANTNSNSSEMHKSHAVAGYVCDGKGYIYDSNQRKIFKCDWWKRDQFIKVANTEIALFYSFFKGGQINVHRYAFAIFARKEFTKDIGAACLMKYKTKTPNLGLSNNFFRNRASGEKINKLFPQLKPAQRAALKRKWARTEHRAPVYINKATFNSIVAGAKTGKNASQKVINLESAGYKWKNENYNEYAAKLDAKFPIKKASPSPKTYTFAEAKARMNQFKSTAALRKYHYSLVWKGIPLVQRRVLMHFRNTGEWLANNAFENKAKPPIKRKAAPVKKESPSPRTKRTTQVKSNFEKYWKSLQPDNRKVLRNYISGYKSPSPPKPKNNSPNRAGSSNQPLRNAKANVNSLKTAVARNGYLRQRGPYMSIEHRKSLKEYIKAKNVEAQRLRSVKRAKDNLKGKGKA